MRAFIRGLLAAGAAAVLVAASPALAATLRFPDKHGDLANGMDIRWVRVVNNRPLVIVVKHRRIDPKAGGWAGAYVRVDPHHRGPSFYLVGAIHSKDQMYWMNGWKIGGTWGCHGYTMRFSVARDTTRFVIPRRCLNGADFRTTRVQVAARAGLHFSGPSDWAPGRRHLSPWVAYK